MGVRQPVQFIKSDLFVVRSWRVVARLRESAQRRVVRRTNYLAQADRMAVVKKLRRSSPNAS